MTNLRKKNFNFRSKITEMEDKAKQKKEAEQRNGGKPVTNPNGSSHPHTDQMDIVRQMQKQEMREREKQMIMMTMMDSMIGQHSAEAEEQRLLQ